MRFIIYNLSFTVENAYNIKTSFSEKSTPAKCYEFQSNRSSSTAIIIEPLFDGNLCRGCFNGDEAPDM